MKLFDRYILKTHLGTFFFSLVTIMFMFMLSFVTQFLDRLIGKGLDFGIIVEVVLLQSAWMVGLAVPMAVLVTTVMSFSALTNSSELTVMRAGGISIYRLVAPVLIVAAGLSLLMERYNNVLMPEANFRANALFADITRLKPALGLDKNAFSDMIKGYSIMARDVDNKTGELRDIVLYDRAQPDVRTVILAARGKIEFTPDNTQLVLTLEDGQVHELRLPAMDRYRTMSFSKNRYVFNAAGYDFERSAEGRRRGGKELSASDLLAVAQEFREKGDAAERSAVKGVDELKAAVERIRSSREGSGSEPAVLPPVVPGRATEAVNGMLGDLNVQLEQMHQHREDYRKYMIEYHKKYSLAFACLVFAVVGSPLGVMARRGGFGAGAALSLFFFVLYWVLMIGGEKIADQGQLSPAVSVWLPNAILTCAGLFMLYRLSHSVNASAR
ncbi:MAG TPA: YjgP/YjgQ family permease [Chlorobaculum parvum]|uniref:YjgP/YjgQ family permease n=1 Tax=Chlorobaculum parvum TaxID=274539 RepID=A0A7C5DLU6_9CHLB|nr:YjgP/YjgQ family permease [Chlorobaculum parvum]